MEEPDQFHKLPSVLDTTQEQHTGLAKPLPNQSLVSGYTADSQPYFAISYFHLHKTLPECICIHHIQRIFDQTAIREASSIAANLFRRTSTMCKFYYRFCGSCPRGFPCRIYSHHVEWCQRHLDGFHWHKNRPEPVCLVIEQSDEKDDLEYFDRFINFRTKPTVRSEQFSDKGCPHHEFYLEEGPSIPCPYHEPGGLKDRGIRERNYRDNVEKYKQRNVDIEEARNHGAEIYGRLKATAEKRAEEAQRARGKALKKEEKGCCIVQ